MFIAWWIRLNEAISLDRRVGPNRQKHFVIDGEAVIFGVDSFVLWIARHSPVRAACLLGSARIQGDGVLRNLFQGAPPLVQRRLH